MPIFFQTWFLAVLSVLSAASSPCPDLNLIHYTYLNKHHGITLHHSTVYRHLRQDKSNGGTLWQHLRICSKPYRKRYGSTWAGGKVPNCVGIENRPAIVDRKTRIGDWEADTIVGKNQKSALLTLVERTTRYTIIVDYE